MSREVARRRGPPPRMAHAIRGSPLGPAVVATWLAARSALAQVATDRSPRQPSQDRALVPPATSDQAVPEEVSVRGVQRARNALDVTVSAPEARKAAGTEGDPAKIVFDLPGVARPAFDSGGLVVWGSAPTDTRVYVDGV